MKSLICGDIHGNLPAFEAMLKLEKDNYDILICHGDVVNYGPWSNECVELLDNQSNSVKLLGNHELAFIKSDYNGNHPIAKAFFNFCYPMFNRYLINSLKKYQTNIEIGGFIIQHTIADKKIFLDTNVLDIDISKNYIIGHSHQQFEREVNGFKIFNTGSLGQDRKYINQSCYLILDNEKKSVEMKSFTHNIDMVINKMKSENYPKICIEYYKSKARI